MAVGLGLLRLPPEAFWSMTMREFAAAASALLGPPSSSAAPSRAGLANLMSRFPDNS